MGNNKLIKIIDYPKYMEIEKGDIIFISSDISIMCYEMYISDGESKAENFIDGLIEAVGEEGTVIFPTYNWNFCKGIGFDYFTTACKTGSLGKIALTRKDFKRTRHPIYSFAVFGKYQEELCNINNIDSFGSDSLFDFFREKNVKNYLIDVRLGRSFTYVHYVEQQSGVVNYRYIKEFSANYTDENGNTEEKIYSMFVRDLDLDVKNTIDLIEEDLINGGAEKIFKINSSKVKKIELGKAYDIIMNDIKNNKSRKICTFKGQNE